MSRLAIIGDVGGHWEELFAAIVSLGVNPDTLVMPDDLVICQVGDLIHRGPDSAGVVALVDSVLEVNGNRWIQLAGNHEANHLFRPQFDWDEELPEKTIETLHGWWTTGKMVLAAHFETAGVEVRRSGGTHEQVGAGDLLVTHAGLTSRLWQRLGSPASASQAAFAINAQRFDPSGPVWSAGRMLHRQINHAAGVVWAEDADELLGSWLDFGRFPIDRDRSPAFHQAHGHTSAFDWSRARWRQPRLAEALVGNYHVDQPARVLRCEIDGRVFWGCDPGHGKYPAHRWSPLVLELVA